MALECTKPLRSQTRSQIFGVNEQTKILHTEATKQNCILRNRIKLQKKTTVSELQYQHSVKSWPIHQSPPSINFGVIRFYESRGCPSLTAQVIYLSFCKIVWNTTWQLPLGGAQVVSPNQCDLQHLHFDLSENLKDQRYNHFILCNCISCCQRESHK